MPVPTDTDDFTPALGCLVSPAIGELAAQLGEVAGLTRAECDVIALAATECLYHVVHPKVSRVLLLELNAARVTGRLAGADARGRWDEFMAVASDRSYWDDLVEHYPSLMGRLDRIVANRVAAVAEFAVRYAADKEAIGLGDLTGVAFGAGDSHRDGRTVAIVTAEAGRVVYKPRSVAIDAALANLLDFVSEGASAGHRIRVPAVIERPGYGWAEHVEHRYCRDDAELAMFYRGIGEWLAVMRLLSGVDLHAENMIAVGPVPMVIDCETLFTPVVEEQVSGYGRATDRAVAMVDRTVLSSGLLPGRGTVLGWRGVDMSAVGALPGEQPTVNQPVIIDAGSDTARLGFAPVELQPSANHPSATPELARFWGSIVDGFDDVDARLRVLDRDGTLEPALAAMADCPIRVVPRATEAYAELGRMLWHPVSLHDPEPAIARAIHLLTRMHETAALAPGDPVVVRAEVEDLLYGDVPFFTTTGRRGRLDGPGGTAWLPERDLVAGALTRWRAADLPLERQVIRATLVNAYLNDGWVSDGKGLTRAHPHPADLDRRRRAAAAGIMTRLSDAAIRSDEDGTATWIASILNETGRAVQPLSSDLYLGAPGVAVALAAYLREESAGRADPVPGLTDLLRGVLTTMRLTQDQAGRDRREEMSLRPQPPGAYIGVGSQIWAYLLLERLAPDYVPDAVERAVALGDLMPAALAANDVFDVTFGTAGAIPALLDLAARTGEERFLATAVTAGDLLAAGARRDSRGARWGFFRWPDGMGGFAHGASGIGWALRLLGQATGAGTYLRLAQEAAAFEETTYDPVVGSWRDLRREGTDMAGTAAAWCHGALGIGLSTLDDDVRQRAAEAVWASGLGSNHTLCHGDLGSWELLATTRPAGVERITVEARIISDLELNGPVSGVTQDIFSAGLLAGLGGIAYQLLRMHPRCDLPSVLIR